MLSTAMLMFTAKIYHIADLINLIKTSVDFDVSAYKPYPYLIMLISQLAIKLLIYGCYNLSWLRNLNDTRLIYVLLFHD